MTAHSELFLVLPSMLSGDSFFTVFFMLIAIMKCYIIFFLKTHESFF